MKAIDTKKPKMSRLEARVSVGEKKLFKHAAALQGRSLTEFLVRCAHDAAKRTVQEHEVMELSARDRKAFIAALLKPPVPGKRLKKAARWYRSPWGFNPNPEAGSAKNGQARLSSRAAISGEAIQISGLLRCARNDEPQLFPIFNK